VCNGGQLFTILKNRPVNKVSLFIFPYFQNNKEHKLSGKATLLGDLQVFGNVVVGRLEGDRQIDDVITLYTEQNITSQIQLKEVVTGDVVLDGLLGGVPVHLWNESVYQPTQDNVSIRGTFDKSMAGRNNNNNNNNYNFVFD